MMPTFAEFFAGAGFARLGLGSAWQCVFANEICPMKAATYRANFGAGHLVEGDVRDVAADAVPAADLWWVSFPCQDHSAAGLRLGFQSGERGALVFRVMHLLHGCLAQGKAPTVIVLENVAGLLSAGGGQDFTDVATALASSGYAFGAVDMDARDFVPQSRPRVFVVAVLATASIPPSLSSGKPGRWQGSGIRRAATRLPPTVARHWRWWLMPTPAARKKALADVVDRRPGFDHRWTEAGTVARLLEGAGPSDTARLDAARASGREFAGTVTMRPGTAASGKGRRFSFRDDGLAGCILGKDSRHHQQLCLIDGDRTYIRPFSRFELSRLMGLPHTYVLPGTKTEAYRTIGDGVVVPVVRWLAASLLEPLVASAPGMTGTPAPMSGPTDAKAAARPKRARKAVVAVAASKGVGMREMTIGTTAYYLPDEADRLRSVAVAMGTSFHEAMLRGWDRLLAERGMPPVRRVPSTRTR